MNVKKFYNNALVSLILISSILLSLSFLSPCFQKHFLDDKNLYKYLREK